MSRLVANPNQIKMGFDKSEKDAAYAWGEGCDKTDIIVLHEAIFYLKDSQGQTVAEQLKERGFDISTLKVSIQK